MPILKVFAVGRGQEPRLALLCTGTLCAGGILLGDLNVVAPIITMFFLMCYLCVNMSCCLNDLLDEPSWRPTFRFYHWAMALTGMLLCVALMFLINPGATAIAWAFAFVIFMYASHNSHSVNWGDGFKGMRFQWARNVLAHVSRTQHYHIKNWRPQVLLLTGLTPDSDGQGLMINDMELVSFVSQLKHGQGVCIIGGIVSNQSVHESNASRNISVEMKGLLEGISMGDGTVHDWHAELQDNLKDLGVQGFVEVLYTTHLTDGIMILLQTAGLGAFEPNTVVAAWPWTWAINADVRRRFLQTIQCCTLFDKAVVICKEGHQFPVGNVALSGNIDIWWMVSDGGILLMLPFLLQRHAVWRHCHLRLFTVIHTTDDPHLIKKELEMYVAEHRIQAEVHVVLVQDFDVEVSVDGGTPSASEFMSQRRQSYSSNSDDGQVPQDSKDIDDSDMVNMYAFSALRRLHAIS